MPNKALMVMVATATILALAGIIDISTQAEGASPMSLSVFQNGKANHHPVDTGSDTGMANHHPVTPE